MSYDDIIDLFNSDKFDNDVWAKIDYILSKTNEYTSDELIEIYDSLY
jgi:hypothetical protein